MRYVFVRAVLGAVPVLGVLLWFRVFLDVEGLGGLVAAGTVMLAVFAFVWVFFVYRGDPYFDVRAHLARFAVWSRC